MKQRIRTIIMALGIVLGIGIFALPVPSASAIDVIGDACTGNSDSAICKNKNDNIGTTITTVINVLLFIVGIISVIMIIIGGIMYAVSAGDAGAVTKAKNTIFYAIIGLVVAFFAYAIVNWVIKRFQ